MPTSGDATGTSGGPEGQEPVEGEFTWTSHQARARPLVAVLVTVFVAFLVAVVQKGFEDPVMTGFAVAILTLSLAPFYLPTRYAIAEDTVTVRTPFSSKVKKLKLFRRWQVDRHGILLSPFDRPSRLDRFHGLNLRFDAPDRERVTEYIRSRFARDDGEG